MDRITESIREEAKDIDRFALTSVFGLCLMCYVSVPKHKHFAVKKEFQIKGFMQCYYRSNFLL